VSCPCALVISVPLTFFAGIGGASRAGILVKGGNYLEALSRVKTVVFDKTGTLTRGKFEVSRTAPEPGVDEAELLAAAAKAEVYSNHPIALAIKNASPTDESGVGRTEELAGFGVKTEFDGHILLVGNGKLMESVGIASPEVPGTAVHVARDGRYLGNITLEDLPKPDAKEAVARLKAMGIKTAMLTGDSRRAAERAAELLSIDEAHAELLPGDKVRIFEGMADRAAFVGDGINDAPVLKRADAGIAMGGLGSDAAIEAADVVIMTDEPSKVARAVAIARKTTRIAGQNVALALTVKFAVLILSALGVATMWEAVFADVGVSLLAVLNAVRALRAEENGNKQASQRIRRGTAVV
jgi:Cd2+/Zn2+-exporting ATPase